MTISPTIPNNSMPKFNMKLVESNPKLEKLSDMLFPASSVKVNILASIVLVLISLKLITYSMSYRAYYALTGKFMFSNGKYMTN
jgi:hypothetical protein